MISPAIGSVIRDRIRDLRERAGLGRDELAQRAREHGAGESFTANVVGFLERGRRGLAVDELLALAQALEVSPLELLGDAAHAFVGEQAPPACPRCDGATGPLETAVTDDIKALGDLRELEASMAATAVRLAREIDQAGGEQVKVLPQLTRELRATLVQITAGRAAGPEDDDDEDLDDLDDPD